MKKTRHGKSRTETYFIWIGIKKRCFNPNDEAFSRYGGRGITMIQSWKDSFLSFLSDMGERPSPKHSVDRIDNDGNYEPENCRWATCEEQGRNKKNNVFLMANGQTKLLVEWADEIGVNPDTIRMRILRGMPMEKVLRRGNLPRSGVPHRRKVTA